VSHLIPNKMRPERSLNRRTQRAKKTGFIEKLYMYPLEETPLAPQIFAKNNTELQSIVSDGGLRAEINENSSLVCDERSNVLYSLNKRKRWILPGLLEDAIDNKLSDKSFPVTCFVRTALTAELHSEDYNPQGSYYRGPKRTVAVSLAMHSGTDEQSESPKNRNTESKKATCKHPGRPSDLCDLVIKLKRSKLGMDNAKLFEKRRK
jgi:hypothetical protein